MNVVFRFIGGVVMTLFFVTLMPTVANCYITPFLIDQLAYLNLPPEVYSFLVSIMAYVVIVALTLLVGGGGVLREFGIFGVIGLVVAYWLLGDVTQCFIPLLSLAVTAIILWPIRSTLDAKKKIKEEKKEIKSKIKEEKKEIKEAKKAAKREREERKRQRKEEREARKLARKGH